MRLRILFVTLQNTNALPSAITWDELNNLAPSDCVKKRQQAFWRRCRGMVATLSTDSVHPRIFSFSLFLPQPPLPMEQLSLLQLSSTKSEFYEPAPSADPILSTSYELDSG